MKKSILLLVGCLICSFSYAEQVYIYNEKGEKIYYQKIDTVKMVHYQEAQDPAEIRLRVSHSQVQTEAITPSIYRVRSHQTKKQLAATFQESAVDYISDLLLSKDSSIVWASDEIILRIDPENDLRGLLNRFHIPYTNIRNIGSNPHTYVVTLPDAENTLAYANILYESRQVAYAQPSFWRQMKSFNAYEPAQWNLHNTGQVEGLTGMDIHVLPAWNLSTGSGVKVAVLDEGVDLTHPDLIDNLLPDYDATDGKYGGINGGCKGHDAHGTECAGIIAAGNNDIGVKGIAYDAKMIPIRINYQVGFGNWVGEDEHGNLIFDTWAVEGVKQAWLDQKADILS